MSASRTLGVVFALALLGLAFFPLVGDRFYVQFASKIMFRESA